MSERILMVSDAWHPQVNGVVRTVEETARVLKAWGHEVLVIGPDSFTSVPMPTYNEIRLSIFPYFRLARMIREFRPTMINLATEGPLGWAARRWCRKNRFPFTTTYNTRFPEFIAERLPVPLALSYAVLRHFHNAAAAVLAPTASIAADLSARGFQHVGIWSRGVDTSQFKPTGKAAVTAARPVFMFVGRIAVEKNIRDFLDLNLPGSKVVVGGGPQLEELKKAYPGVLFTGPKSGEELARHYSAADVFVFPSKTDTYGLVLLESLACGVPVAAYPAPGPKDVLGGHPDVAVVDENLCEAALAALRLSPDACRNFALARNWEAATREFLDQQVRAEIA